MFEYQLIRRSVLATRIEEESAIHLIRTGHLYKVDEVIFGRTPFTCFIRALTPVADLILEKWNSMEGRHQDPFDCNFSSFSGELEIGRSPSRAPIERLKPTWTWR